MTRREFATARKKANQSYKKECNTLAQRYFKARVPLKRNVVYETSLKPPKGLTNRFVVFIIQVQHYLEIEMFNVVAGVWWLYKNNKCAKWHTIHGVDNPNGAKFKRSKDQSFIKPEPRNERP